MSHATQDCRLSIVNCRPRGWNWEMIVAGSANSYNPIKSNSKVYRRHQPVVTEHKNGDRCPVQQRVLDSSPASEGGQISGQSPHVGGHSQTLHEPRPRKEWLSFVNSGQMTDGVAAQSSWEEGESRENAIVAVPFGSAAQRVADVWRHWREGILRRSGGLSMWHSTPGTKKLRQVLDQR